MVILAVDDEEGALKILMDGIKQVSPDDELFGFSSAIKALDFAENKIPDVAFLDVQMPAMNGIQVAKILKRINPKINIVFATGYSEYSLEALSLHVSGYLMKPIMPEDIKRELNNLRNPISGEITNNKIVVKTFGLFDIFVNGVPVVFSRKPAKELLALLVDMEGVSCSKKYISALLFEDKEYTRSTQIYFSMIVKDLIDSLKKVNAEHIIIHNKDSYSVDVNAFSCDAYDYLNGKAYAFNHFYGEYMTQYSWSEEKLSKFYK